MTQAGLAHTIANAIAATAEDLKGLFWANIGLIGGNVMLPGFKQRLWVSQPFDCATHQEQVLNSI